MKIVSPIVMRRCGQGAGSIEVSVWHPGIAPGWHRDEPGAKVPAHLGNMAISRLFGGTVELILNLQALPAGGPILMPSGEPAFTQANSSFKIACYPAPDEHHKRTALPGDPGIFCPISAISTRFCRVARTPIERPPSRDRATNREFIRDNLPEAIYLRCVADAGVSVRTHKYGRRNERHTRLPTARRAWNAYQELLPGDDRRFVKTVAVDSGSGHLGYFSGVYVEQFDEFPSDSRKYARLVRAESGDSQQPVA